MLAGLDGNGLAASITKDTADTLSEDLTTRPPAWHEDAPVMVGDVLDELVRLASQRGEGVRGDAGNTDDGTTGLSAPLSSNGMRAAEIRYFEDFEGDEPSREWSVGQLSDMEPYSRFAGPYRTSEHSLSVRTRKSEAYVLTFDLYFVAASIGDRNASDLFTVYINDEPMLEERIADLYDENIAFNKDTDDFDPRIFRKITLAFGGTDDVGEIRFGVSRAGTPGGESWGIDNVLVDFSPDFTIGEAGGAANYEIQMYGWPVHAVAPARRSPRLGGSGGTRGTSPGASNNDRPRRRRPPTPVSDDEPSDDPPSDDPPIEDPPIIDPPVDDPPTDDPPIPAPGPVALMIIGGALSARRRRPTGN